MEAALANAVVENARDFQGLLVSPFLKKAAFVFFAVDNTDLSEDTADGKETTHGTITAVYQKAEVFEEPIAIFLKIGGAPSVYISLYNIDKPNCNKPKPQPAKKTDHFVTSKEVSESYKLTQLGWIVATAFSRKEAGKR